MILPASSQDPIVNSLSTPGIVMVIGASSVINETKMKGKCIKIQINNNIDLIDDISDLGIEKEMRNTLMNFILNSVDIDAMACNVPDLNNFTVDFGTFDKQGNNVVVVKESGKMNVKLKFTPFEPSNEAFRRLEGVCACTVTIGGCSCCCGRDDMCEC